MKTKKNPHAVALGHLGGTARAKRMTAAERSAAAALAGKHAPGWPKGKPRGPRRQIHLGAGWPKGKPRGPRKATAA